LVYLMLWLLSEICDFKYNYLKKCVR